MVPVGLPQEVEVTDSGQQAVPRDTACLLVSQGGWGAFPLSGLPSGCGCGGCGGRGGCSGHSGRELSGPPGNSSLILRTEMHSLP